MFDNTFTDRATAWLHSHDTGMSSKAIFHYMTLGIKGGATPSDTSDLGRCVRLLDRFPEFQARVSEMSCVSDDWAALMSIWDELVAAYRDDLANKGEGRDWRSDEMLNSLWWDKSAGAYWTRRKHGFTAQAMSAGTAETAKQAQGQRPASAVGNADAP